MKESGEKMDYKALVLEWRTRSHQISGTNIVFEHIANTFNTNISSIELASQSLGYQLGESYYTHALLDRAIIFDKYVKRFLKVNDADVLIRNSMCGGFYKHNIPMVTFFQDPSFSLNKFLLDEGDQSWDFEYGHSYVLMQRATAENSLVVANSIFMEEELKKIGIEAQHIVPLGVDLDLFKPKEVDRPEKQKKYKKTAIWVGKHHPSKWKFMSELINLHEDVYWILVFSGRSHQFRAKFAENVEIHQNVSPEGMAFLYNRADFLVSTSPVESFGLALLEAMACGKPVIGFNTGLLYDLKKLHLHDFKGGYIIEKYDLEPFHEAITSICEEKESFNPRSVAENFSLKDFKKCFKEVVVNYIEEYNKNRS